MKKTITKPDGTTEVVEGTAEEIAEYERNVRKSEIREAPPKKKGILKGNDRTDFANEITKKGSLTLEEVVEQLFSRPIQTPPLCHRCDSVSPWFGIVPPPCTCGRSLDFRYQPYRFTWTSSTSLVSPENQSDEEKDDAVEAGSAVAGNH